MRLSVALAVPSPGALVWWTGIWHSMWALQRRGVRHVGGHTEPHLLHRTWPHRPQRCHHTTSHGSLWAIRAHAAKSAKYAPWRPAAHTARGPSPPACGSVQARRGAGLVLCVRRALRARRPPHLLWPESGGRRRRACVPTHTAPHRASGARRQVSRPRLRLQPAAMHATVARGTDDDDDDAGACLCGSCFGGGGQRAYRGRSTAPSAQAEGSLATRHHLAASWSTRAAGRTPRQCSPCSACWHVPSQCQCCDASMHAGWFGRPEGSMSRPGCPALRCAQARSSPRTTPNVLSAIRPDLSPSLCVPTQA